MKSTYTLLSIYLDNKPLLRNGFKIESSKNYIRAYLKNKKCRNDRDVVY
jgi:hypothetical protein